MKPTDCPAEVLDSNIARSEEKIKVIIGINRKGTNIDTYGILYHFMNSQPTRYLTMGLVILILNSNNYVSANMGTSLIVIEL